MGFISRLLGREEQRLQVQSDAGSLLPPVFSLFAGGPSDAGVGVDQVSALTVTTVLRCVSLISSTIATLPMCVVNQADQQKASGHSLQPLLRRSPNPYMNQAVFREAILTNALLWGAGYAYIERDELGQTAGLFPLRSDVTRPVRLDGNLWFITQLGTEVAYLRPDQVLVVNGGITLDGISPLAPIGNARNAIGLSLALEKFAAKFFKNGGNLGGILKLPAGMGEDAVKNFKASWVRNYTGPENSLKTAVLTADMQYTPTGTAPEAGQMLGSREHQVREVCRVFGVPPHLAFDLEKSSYASIEQQSLEFMQYGIQPHCVRFEQEAGEKLLLTREQDTLEIKLDLTAMLRSDTTARYAAYNVGLQAGFMTVNEVRGKEGLPPVTGGDVLRVPLNMAPAAPGLNPPAPGTPPTNQARALIADAAGRLLHKECLAVRRAAKKHAGDGEAFCQWAEGFYRSHEQLITRTMLPALSLLASAPTDYAKRHTDISLDAVLEGFEAGTLDDVLDEFETTRPGEIAEKLVTGNKV